MTWLLPYLPQGVVAPVAFMAAGGAIVVLVRKYVRKENSEAFSAAVQPFLTAIAPLSGLPDDVNRLGDAVRGMNSRLDALRSQMEGIAQTANTAHSMAVDALKASAAATATAAATSSQLSTHVNRYPHGHNGSGAGYGDP